MEFFELGIDRIHKLIYGCFSVAAEKGLWFGLASLLISLVLLYFGKKFKLFTRESKTRQFFVRTYNFYIPVIFVFCGFAFGAALATKDFFASETQNSISPLMKLVFPAFQSHVNTHWDRVIQTRMSFYQTVDEYISDIKFSPRNEGFMEGISTSTANFMVPKITKWGIESVVTTAKDIALKQSEEQGYIETSKVKALLIVHSLSIFNYPPGLWDETNSRLEKKAVFFFWGVAGNVLLIFLFLLLFPVAETVQYLIFSKRKKSRRKNFPEHQGGRKKRKNRNRGEQFEELERIPSEKPVIASVNIEIPTVFEN